MREASATLPGNARVSQLYDPWKPVIFGGAFVHGSFERLYPHIARWVQAHGYHEIRCNDYRRSFVRPLDIRSMFWERLESYPAERNPSGSKTGISRNCFL